MVVAQGVNHGKVFDAARPRLLAHQSVKVESIRL